jgi:hypothetical protein
LILGDKEQPDGLVTVRDRIGKNQRTLRQQDFFAEAMQLNKFAF